MNKHSTLLRKFVNYVQKKFYNIGPCTIKLFTAVILPYRNKLERFQISVTFTLVYYWGVSLGDTH